MPVNICIPALGIVSHGCEGERTGVVREKCVSDYGLLDALRMQGVEAVREPPLRGTCVFVMLAKLAPHLMRGRASRGVGKCVSVCRDLCITLVSSPKMRVSLSF